MDLRLVRQVTIRDLCLPRLRGLVRRDAGR